MEKTKINYVIDFLMIISFIVTAITGLVIFFFLPSGLKQGGYQTFLGIIKTTWSAVHDWSGIIFIILIIVHFILHWNWIISMTKNIFSNKNKELKGGQKIMKNILSILLVFVMAISLVFAAQGNIGTGQTDTGSDVIQSGQGSGEGAQTDIGLSTQNQGEETQLQNQVQVKVQSGNYMNQAGEQMQIQTGQGNEVKLQSGNVEAKTTMIMTQEQVQNKTILKTQLSNGKNAEIKVMPDTASERAVERLQLKVCNSDNNCSIELKEVGSGEQVKVTYEIKAQKEARVLGMFKTKMQVQAQIDAETGEVLQSKKPWWAFLASE